MNNNFKHQPPLSLYVHIPWCIKKCFYCDFNSYALKKKINEQQYINHLIKDLSCDLKLFNSTRKINSIFIGGGTPSLFSSESIKNLLDEIKKRIPTSSKLEITIESNPSSIESTNFLNYKNIGINRISIGIQTFNSNILNKLGRTYSSSEAKKVLKFTQLLKFNNLNVDLMHSLPQQSTTIALKDLSLLITNYKPNHISWYQLSIEKNTFFYKKKPTLPTEETTLKIIHNGRKLLKKHNYIQYEISSYAKKGCQCQHNRNYWQFGDYIGIGCGAHGKFTTNTGKIFRTIKNKKITDFMQGKYLNSICEIKKNEQALEFFMNKCRLFEPIPKKHLYRYTQTTEKDISSKIQQAVSEGYLKDTCHHWITTNKGKKFLNSLLEIFA